MISPVHTTKNASIRSPVFKTARKLSLNCEHTQQLPNPDSIAGDWNFGSMRIFSPEVPLHSGQGEISSRSLTLPLQRKLEIGSADDPLEREADHIAELVMHMPDTIDDDLKTANREKLRRKCDCGKSLGSGDECEDCQREQKNTVRRSVAQTVQIGEVPDIVNEVLFTPGQRLDPVMRAYFEPRLGYDFSRVRLHTDVRAAESARTVHARAYTVGEKIVFGSGQYVPTSREGKALLAHELAHVVQQGQDRGQTLQSAFPRPRADDHGRNAIVWPTPPDIACQSSFPRVETSGQRIQRQVESEGELIEPEIENENDVSEVQDGDSTVSASPDTTEASSQDLGLGGRILTEAKTPGLQVTEGIGTSDVLPTQAGSAQEKDKPKPAQPTKPTSPKKITSIDVDQASQVMTVTWSDGSTETHNVSTGRGRPNTKHDPCNNQTEKNCTPNGSFKVGSLGNAGTANAHGDRMSWYVGFVDSRGIGIHDSQPVPGVPHSHGCVRVGDSPADDAFAKKINKNVMPGKTTVIVHGKAPTKPYSKPTPQPKRTKPKNK